MFDNGYYKPQLLLGLLTLMFAGYGVQELREASEDGTSLHDGFEALGMAAVTFALCFVVVWVNRRRTRREEHFDAR